MESSDKKSTHPRSGQTRTLLNLFSAKEIGRGIRIELRRKGKKRLSEAAARALEPGEEVFLLLPDSGSPSAGFVCPSDQRRRRQRTDKSFSLLFLFLGPASGKGKRGRRKRTPRRERRKKKFLFFSSGSDASLGSKRGRLFFLFPPRKN